MSLAADIATILADPYHSVRWVAGAASGRGVMVTRDTARPDDLQGTVLVRERVLRVPVAQLATSTYGNSVTVDGVAYTVRDNRVGSGGHIRELVLA